jgi:endoglucanase
MLAKKLRLFSIILLLFTVYSMEESCGDAKRSVSVDEKSDEQKGEPASEADNPVLGKENTFVYEHGRLSVSGTQMVDQKGNPVILRGVSLGWHNWWPRFYNAETVNTLVQDWRCTLVRAAMGVDADNNCYIQNTESSVRHVTEVVDAAIANGIYVIIDWHSHNIHLREAKVFFAGMAKKYKDYPNIIYEIYNEPNGPTWEEVKAYSEAVIDTIRTIDKHNIILVGSPEWDQRVDLPAANPITGREKLMYTMHFYAATHKQWLRDRCVNALKTIPLFISECAGMEASGDGTIDLAEWNAWVNWMNDNRISWTAWSVSDKNESCSMIKNTSSPAYGWKDNDLKEWGKIIKTHLQTVNNEK